MIDQKTVCQALGKELGVAPKWDGDTCVIENEDAVLRIDRNAAVEMKVKNPEKGKELVKIVRKVYLGNGAGRT